ncbi:MAG TPA: 3-dehydroquinate synthase [Pirellulales bacterium]
MNTSPRIVHVQLGPRSYPIEIGTGNLGRSAGMMLQCQPVTHAVIITDMNVSETHAASVARSLDAEQIAVDLLVIEPGEAAKCVDTAEQLWQKLLDLRTDRRSWIVAVGGGVVGDLAGFVAATFTRGLSFLQVPTTLLAQVDSSVGGKVGVNLPSAKNMVGAFWQPRAVLIDTAVLATLPEREYRSGLAEVVKYGVILDAEFFEFLDGRAEALLNQDPRVLESVIERCCQLKADVVAADECDLSGRRAVLNYGHTFCHALETLTGYSQLLHGEGVAIGMQCAARLAERLGRVDAGFTTRQRDLLVRLGLPVAVPKLDHQAIVDCMARDKKVEHGRLHFVLPSRLGHVELVSGIDSSDVLAALQD